MSTRALRVVAAKQKKKNKEEDVVLDDSDDIEEEDEGPVMTAPRKHFNAFVALGGMDDEGDVDNGDDDDVDGGQDDVIPMTPSPSKAKSKKKKKKKKKTSGDSAAAASSTATNDINDDEVERSIQEVNTLLGVVTVAAPSNATSSHTSVLDTRGLLCVEYRHLNADNEMRRIFGARVVRTERRQAGRRDGRLRKSSIITPQGSWHQLGRVGLTMNIVERTGSCAHFELVHDSHYQQTQIEFWRSVDTMNPDAIAAVLGHHPYHLDTLLQLADICKINEDRRVAADLIERAVYAAEGSFHTLFNVATGSNRMDFKKMENRGFFLTFFRHLVMVGMRGCYRTALEFCKLVLGLDPDTDPLGILLILDFYALRSGEYKFLIRLSDEWEAHHHLSKLPNMAFSCALAKFHASGASGTCKVDDVDETLAKEADRDLQEALLNFPMVLSPLLDRCSVVMDSVASHQFFASASQTCPDPLERVCKLYIERTHSVWKEPEVLTWLERIAIQTLSTVDARHPKVLSYAKQRAQLYQKTPRNVLRHIILSDLPSVSAFLPSDVGSVMSYDPLPPEGSYADYERPTRQTVLGADSSANMLTMFLRSILPSYDPNAPAPDNAGAAAGGEGGASLQALTQAVRQAAEGGHAGVAGVLQQVLDMVRGQNAEDEAAGPHDNPGGGDGDGGEGLHGFQAGDFIADDDFEFD